MLSLIILLLITLMIIMWSEVILLPSHPISVVTRWYEIANRNPQKITFDGFLTAIQPFHRIMPSVTYCKYFFPFLCLAKTGRDLVAKLNLTVIPVIQWCEKVFAPFLISYFFACFPHLNVSDHQTNLNISQR